VLPTPNRPSASPDTASRGLRPCIALLGCARRGFSPVQHKANHARSARVPAQARPCAPAATQVIATCIQYTVLPSTSARASCCSALRCHPTTFGHTASVTHGLVLSLRPAPRGLPRALGIAQPLSLPAKRGRPAGLRSPLTPMREAQHSWAFAAVQVQ
jgi:hypothetical protein